MRRPLVLCGKALAAVMVAFVLACGGSASSPTAPNNPSVVTPTPAPTPTLVRIDLSPASVDLTVGGGKALAALAKYTDSTVKDVTPMATWSSTSPSVASVVAGAVTAVAPGSATISVSFGGVTAKLAVAVQTPPVDSTLLAWNKLTPIQQEMVVGGFMTTTRRLGRFDISKPIAFWADPKFVGADVDKIAPYWKGRIGATLQQVADSSKASIKLVFDPAIAPMSNGIVPCGRSGAESVDNYVLLSGRVRINPASKECSTWAVLAHEVGHVLGDMIHAPTGTDIMSDDVVAMIAYVGGTNSDLTVALNFVFHVAPAGWQVPLP